MKVCESPDMRTVGLVQCKIFQAGFMMSILDDFFVAKVLADDNSRSGSVLEIVFVVQSLVKLPIRKVDVVVDQEPMLLPDSGANRLDSPFCQRLKSNTNGLMRH